VLMLSIVSAILATIIVAPSSIHLAIRHLISRDKLKKILNR
jgi:hypothetical protein